MLLWTVFALLTAAVIWALALPLMRDVATGESGIDDKSPQSPDILVYRDQLSEIDTDLQRGLISADEAEAARAEVGRRILSASDGRAIREPADVSSGKGHRESVVALIYAIAVAVPLLSAGLYAFVGSPGLPGRSHMAQVAAAQENSDIEDSVAKVEAHLRDEPQDGRGWHVIAPIYMGLGRFEDARVAYRQAVLLLGPDERRLMGLGRASVFAEKGKITGEARDAFARVSKLAPDNLEAQLWLARFLDQQGETENAIPAYEVLLARSKDDAPWRSAVEQRLGELRGNGNKNPTATVDSNKVDAVSNMSDAERAQFIGRMVDGLAARLKTNGDDIDGWLRLVRAYTVIGRGDDAKSALGRAREIFKSDETKLSRLDGLARELGLGS